MITLHWHAAFLQQSLLIGCRCTLAWHRHLTVPYDGDMCWWLCPNASHGAAAYTFQRGSLSTHTCATLVHEELRARCNMSSCFTVLLDVCQPQKHHRCATSLLDVAFLNAACKHTCTYDSYVHHILSNVLLKCVPRVLTFSLYLHCYQAIEIDDSLHPNRSRCLRSFNSFAMCLLFDILMRNGEQHWCLRFCTLVTIAQLQ
jgi:hypothetical protein